MSRSRSLALVCRVLLVSALVLSARAGRAQDDVEGSKDHPLIPRIPGYHISNYEQLDFESHEFPIGDDTAQTVEGKRWAIEYWLKEGARRNSPVEITRNYRNAFTQKGAKVMNADPAGNSAVFLVTQGSGQLWCHLRVSNGGEVYEWAIVEKAAMAQQVALSAAELANALNTAGSVAVRDILFDTGRATIKPESAASLATIGEVLKADPALELEIQGHTDNVGAKDANMKLSQARAAAVQQSLVQTYAVAPSRLTAAGFGDTRPVADNSTDAGRALNRRVELVKK